MLLRNGQVLLRLEQDNLQSSNATVEGPLQLLFSEDQAREAMEILADAVGAKVSYPARLRVLTGKENNGK